MTDRERKIERRVLRDELNRSIDKHRPVWPMLASALIGWALLLLFLLPFCSITYSGTTSDYSMIQLILGSFAGGSANFWLGTFFALLILAPIIPLASRRQSYLFLVIADLVEACGIVGLMLGFRENVISQSFIGAATLEPVYDRIGFILPIVLLALYLGVPFLARAISTGIAIRRFDRSVKAGKKLLNY